MMEDITLDRNEPEPEGGSVTVEVEMPENPDPVIETVPDPTPPVVINPPSSDVDALGVFRAEHETRHGEWQATVEERCERAESSATNAMAHAERLVAETEKRLLEEIEALRDERPIRPPDRPTMILPDKPELKDNKNGKHFLRRLGF